MTRVLFLLGAAIMAGNLLISCGSTTESRGKQDEVIVEETQVEGTAAGMPVSVRVRRILKRQTLESITSSTKLDVPDIPWGEVGQAALGGLTSTLPGLGGLAGLAVAAFAWFQKKRSDKALEQTIVAMDGVREKVGDEVWKESIAPNLKEAQDEEVREKIKTIQKSRKSRALKS